MRKTIILAIATTFLAGASVVTGVGPHGPDPHDFRASPVVPPLPLAA